MAFLKIGTAHAHGSFHERITGISKQIEAKPSDAQLYLQRGEIYLQHEEWENCSADCDTARKLDPAIDVDLLRGRALLGSNKPQQALPLLDGYAKRHPGAPQALLCRARTFSMLGQATEAIADYRETLKHTPHPQPDLIQETANALAAHGCENEAVLVLATGIEKLGPVPSLVLRAMELEIATRQFDAALSRVDVMLKDAPRPEPWMAKRAAVLTQADRIEESKQAWQGLIDHLAALPNLERGSHAMSLLAREAERELASLNQAAPVEKK